MIVEKKERSKIGKKSRKTGKDFEKRTRVDLEEKGWFVSRWNNDIEFDIDLNRGPVDYLQGKIVPAKAKFNPFTKMPMMMSGGFPDFIAFRREGTGADKNYNVIGVECKTNGILDKLEKDKCKWLLEKKVFNKIWIAKRNKIKNKIIVEYEDFTEKYGII
jgi:hypothetical protein